MSSCDRPPPSSGKGTALAHAPAPFSCSAGQPRAEHQETDVDERDRPKLLAIDPPNCGCTECLTGEYVPMSEATPSQIRKLMRGAIADHTNSVWTAVRRGDDLHVEARGHSWVIEDWDHGDPAIDEDGLARFDSAWALVQSRGGSR